MKFTHSWPLWPWQRSKSLPLHRPKSTQNNEFTHLSTLLAACTGLTAAAQTAATADIRSPVMGWSSGTLLRHINEPSSRDRPTQRQQGPVACGYNKINTTTASVGRDESRRLQVNPTRFQRTQARCGLLHAKGTQGRHLLRRRTQPLRQSTTTAIRMNCRRHADHDDEDTCYFIELEFDFIRWTLRRAPRIRTKSGSTQCRGALQCIAAPNRRGRSELQRLPLDFPGTWVRDIAARVARRRTSTPRGARSRTSSAESLPFRLLRRRPLQRHGQAVGGPGLSAIEDAHISDVVHHGRPATAATRNITSAR